MKKLTTRGIIFIYNVAAFIITLTSLYIIKTAISWYWKAKIEEGYKPILRAIDRLELIIESTHPLTWMVIGGSIAITSMMLIAYFLIDWNTLAEDLDIKARVKEEVRRFEGK